MTSILVVLTIMFGVCAVFFGVISYITNYSKDILNKEKELFIQKEIEYIKTLNEIKFLLEEEIRRIRRQHQILSDDTKNINRSYTDFLDLVIRNLHKYCKELDVKINLESKFVKDWEEKEEFSD